MWLVFSPWGDVRYFQSGVAGSQPAQPSVFWTINLRKSASWIERFLKIVYNLGFLWMHYLNDPNQIPMVARWIHRVEKSQNINVFKQTSNLQAISHQKYLVYFLKPLLSDTYVDLVILMQHSLRKELLFSANWIERQQIERNKEHQPPIKALDVVDNAIYLKLMSFK